MEKLKFRRQFLLTPTECEDLKDWQIEKVGNHYLYVHPDCKMEKACGKNSLYLVGYFFDPHNSRKKPIDILTDFARECNIEKYPKLLYRLVGRFILIIKQDEDFIFFHDACGLKSLYYTLSKNEVYAASQPLLIGKVLKLQHKKIYNDYFNSDYVKNKKEHWIPSGLSFYKDVHHLVPNHYFRSSEKSQTRYYPHKNLPKRRYKESLNEFSTLLKNIVTTAHGHLDLAFSLTAGWDSRILLSCCKEIHESVTFYTLKYRDYPESHMDMRTPKLLSDRLKLKHEILDCQQGISEEFSLLYKQNTDMAHLNDWGKIAYGMLKTYPQDKVAVKGNCSEIGRCSSYPDGNHKVSITHLDVVQLVKGWSELKFIEDHIKSWLDEINNNIYDYLIFDLFHWEHLEGSWQAQSQLEWDIVQETFTPFNSRELLDLMLQISTNYRTFHNPALFVDAMKSLWEDVLAEPINNRPVKSRWHNIRSSLLKRTGLATPLYKMVNKWR